MNELKNDIENSEEKEPILNLKDFIERQESIEEYMQVCKFRRKNHLKLLDKILKLEEILSKHF